MRHIAMFVAGFAVVALAGVGVTQTAFFAGASQDTQADDYTFEPSDLPEVQPVASAGKVETTTKTTAVEPESEKAKEEVAPTGALRLVITHPTEGAQVDAAEVTLKGTATPGAYVWSGSHVADVEDDGAWTMTVPLDRGKNVIYVGAKAAGESKTLTRTVFHGDELVWSITQKVKASNTPFEKFYGTGSPGMKITASSPYGSNSTVIGESGEWALGIDFASEPGTTFGVTVSTSTGWTKQYTFSHLGEPKPVTADWTINHKYVENHEPYTKFYGTGPIRTKIVASSEFGSSEAEVGKNGEWYLKVWFDLSEAAIVDVRVTNSLGFDQTYTFTYKPTK